MVVTVGPLGCTALQDRLNRHPGIGPARAYKDHPAHEETDCGHSSKRDALRLAIASRHVCLRAFVPPLSH